MKKLIILAILLMASNSWAANRYWVGATGDWDASDTAVWSTSSGGSGGASVPGASDVAIFDQTDTVCTITANTNVSQVTLTKGTLHTDGATDDSGLTHTWGKFSSNNSNTKVLTLGNSSISLSNNNFPWILSTSGTTFNCNTSTLTFTGNEADSTFDFYPGAGNTYYNIVINPSATGNTPLRIISSFTCTNFTRTGGAAKTQALRVADITITVNGALTFTGNSSINRLLIYGSTLGTPATFALGASATCASNCSNVDFRDITMTGGATNERDLSAITGGSGDCGGNTGITFTTADDWFWNGSGTRNFSDYTYWYTATNGGGSQMASTRCPLPQDTCYIDGASIDGVTRIDQNLPRIPGLDCTNAADFTLDFDNVVQSVYGSLILVEGITYNGNQIITFEGRGNYILDTLNKPFGITIISAIGGKITLASNFYPEGYNRGIVVNYGTFDADIYDVNTTTLSSNNSNTRAIHMGSGDWTIGEGLFDFRVITNLDFQCETSTILFSPSGISVDFWISDAGLTFNNVTFGTSTDFEVRGSNTFNTLTCEAPITVKFTKSTTTTVSSFVAAGTAANNITLDTADGAGTFSLSDASGTNSVSYCNIYRSAATGGATWNAYTTNGNTNGGSNTGWVFTDPGVTASASQIIGIY